LRIAGLLVVGVAALFVCFILGAWYVSATREADDAMGPELEARAAAMFVDFQNKKVATRASLSIGGDCATEVAILGEFDTGAAGFAKTSSPVHRFLFISDGMKAYRFNDEYILVLIKGWYRPDLIEKAAGKRY
jgi:hypothetical protein